MRYYLLGAAIALMIAAPYGATVFTVLNDTAILLAGVTIN